MANLAISTAGAAVGYLVGGQTGAQIGWMIGSYISADGAAVGQANVADLRVQTASYGGNIPLVVGKQRLSGNIIWAADKTTYDIESPSGKGGSSVVGVGYKVSMAIALCKGPILGISRVWSNGQLIVDVNQDSTAKLPGTLYSGSNTQLPDPTMESALGSGNVPAYRGLAYIVLTDFDLGSSGAIPQLSFEVIKQGGL